MRNGLTRRHHKRFEYVFLFSISPHVSCSLAIFFSVFPVLPRRPYACIFLLLSFVLLRLCSSNMFLLSTCAFHCVNTSRLSDIPPSGAFFSISDLVLFDCLLYIFCSVWLLCCCGFSYGLFTFHFTCFITRVHVDYWRFLFCLFICLRPCSEPVIT